MSYSRWCLLSSSRRLAAPFSSVGFPLFYRRFFIVTGSFKEAVVVRVKKVAHPWRSAQRQWSSAKTSCSVRRVGKDRQEIIALAPFFNYFHMEELQELKEVLK